MGNTPLAAILDKALDEALADAEAVRAVLAREQDVLAARGASAPAAIEATVAEKATLLATVARNNDARVARLTAAGLPSDSQRIEELLARSGADSALVARWQRLKSLLDENRRRNEINGTIIRELAFRTRRKLALLRGEVSDPGSYGPGGYGPRGQSAPAGAARVLARA
jgi:flagellar biosynthesis/type III secretory pathway chaperone